MSFVGDDHRYTRGVGAIASMDAVSPARRRAAARAAVAMARRDRVMAIGAIETGQEAAFSRPPPSPTLPLKLVKLAQRPKGLLVPGSRVDLKTRPTVKLPGTVIEPPKTPLDAPKQTAGTTAPPAKAQVNIIAGGSGVAWTSGASKPTAPAVPSSENLPPEWAPEPDAKAAAPAKKTSGNLLLYAALGVGALWLLTRKK